MVNKSKKLVMGIVFLSICFIIFLFRISITERKYKDIQNIFNPITNNDSLNNYVIKKHSFTGFKYTPGIVFITLDNNKVCKISSSLNSRFSNLGINDILIEGDKLVKQRGNDTIFIIKRNEKKLYYVLLKPLN